MIRVFKSRIIQQLLSEMELKALVEDFRGYKETGEVPELFGRDVPYNHPNTLPIVQAEEIHHVHLGNKDKPFPLNRVQFYRTSDIHLVYCHGAFNEDCYLLMTILSPDGHEQAKSRDIMYKLGKMAELFRGKY